MTYSRPRWLSFLVLLAGASVAQAWLSTPIQAQAVGRLVVVPHSIHELTEAEQRAADLVEAGLLARRARIVSMHEARDRLQAVSRPPASPDNSDLDVLAREAHAALEHVAFGRSGAAQRSVQEVFRRAERALESLNRETKTARHVLDACLALVRNALARGERRDALAEAMRCRRLVPDVSPSEMLHPASVIGVLAEADDQLRRMRIGRLTIQSVPESGCAAYVNGRHLGVTPFRLDRAAAGEYRVQVECGRTPGRVHIVQLGDDVVELVVDADFDRALRSGTRVALVYQNEKERTRLVERHGAQVAKSVRADEAVLVRVDGPDAVLVRVAQPDGRVLGRARFPWLRVDSVDAPELEAALDALFQGRMDMEPPTVAAAVQPQPSSPPPAAQGPVEPRPTPSEGHEAGGLLTVNTPPKKAREPMSRTRKLRITAGSLAAAGAGLFAAGLAFEMQRARADAELSGLDPNDPNNELTLIEQGDKYDRGASLRWLGLGGGALMASAVPLLRVDVRGGVPWWSYVLGGAGVGLAVVSGVQFARDGRCELYDVDDSCLQTEEAKGRGALFLAAALPLLAFPISHVLEWSFAKRDMKAPQAFVAPSPTSIAFVVRKEIGSW